MVSKIFGVFNPFLGKWSHLTNIFQRGGSTTTYTQIFQRLLCLVYFSGKNHCFTKDFQLTNPGDSYFYGWLDLQGIGCIFDPLSQVIDKLLVASYTGFSKVTVASNHGNTASVKVKEVFGIQREFPQTFGFNLDIVWYCWVWLWVVFSNYTFKTTMFDKNS